MKNIAQQKADAAGVIDEKGKRKREKDLVLAIQRQVALRVRVFLFKLRDLTVNHIHFRTFMQLDNFQKAEISIAGKEIM